MAPKKYPKRVLRYYSASNSMRKLLGIAPFQKRKLDKLKRYKYHISNALAIL